MSVQLETLVVASLTVFCVSAPSSSTPTDSDYIGTAHVQISVLFLLIP